MSEENNQSNCSLQIIRHVKAKTVEDSILVTFAKTISHIPEDQIEELFEEGTNNQVYIQPVPTKKSIFNIQPRINLY